MVSRNQQNRYRKIENQWKSYICFVVAKRRLNKSFFSIKNWVDLRIKVSDLQKISINDRVTNPNGLGKLKNRYRKPENRWKSDICFVVAKRQLKIFFFSKKNRVDLIIKASESQKISINDRVTSPNGLEKLKNRYRRSENRQKSVTHSDTPC